MTLSTNTIFWQRKPFYLNSTIAANEIQKIVWEGDSVAFATLGCSYLYLRPPTLLNLAVPGSTTADLVTRQAAFIAALSAGSNVCGVVWGGPYNSLATAPDTIAGGNAVADAWLAYLTTVRAGIPAAVKLIPVNMLRRGNSPAGYPQVAWGQCSLRIDADAPGVTGSAVINPQTMPGTPGDGRYYDPDLVHGLPLGYQWCHRNLFAPRLYSERF